MRRPLILIYVLLSINHSAVESVTKTWRHNINVDSRENWLEGTGDCQAVVLPERFTDGCMMAVRRVRTREIVLPTDGELLIQEDAYVSFTDDRSPCVRLKQVGYRKWLHPDSWVGEEENSAVPDAERVPCDHDDVVFPDGYSFEVLYPDVAVTVSSITIRGRNVSAEEWRRLVDSKEDCREFSNDADGPVENTIAVVPGRCRARGGCLCHGDATLVWDFTCYAVGHAKGRAGCSDPIVPVGHCRDFCGGVLQITPRDDFDLELFKRGLPAHENVDLHASRVLKDGRSFIQLVFADKADFNGDSILQAEQMHEKIKGELNRWRVKAVKLVVSGYPYYAKETFQNAMSIILGTFLAIAFVFTSVYLVFVGPLRNYSFKARLPLVNIGAAPARQFVFARFDNKDDGAISMAGSILSLEKSFENPMYGQGVPSTSTATTTETALSKDESEGVEKAFENPLFGRPSASMGAPAERTAVADKPTTSGTTHVNPLYDGLDAKIPDEDNDESEE